MKKFTCLLVALLAAQMIYTQSTCPGEAVAGTAGNSFQAMLKASTDYTAAPNSGVIVAKAGVGVAASGTTICNNAVMCCTVTALQAFMGTRLTALKTALTTYGMAVSKFGGYIAKIAAVASNVNISTYLTASANDLLLTETQAKAFLTQYSNATMYTNDFTAFKGQILDCFNYYQASYQKIACSACADGATAASAAFWQGSNAADTVGEVQITTASCDEWATKCNKVWAFLHRVGGAVHVAAYINFKRDATKTKPPTFGGVYATATDAAGVSGVITAVTNCGTDAASATNAACTAADRVVLCTNFIKAFDATAPISRIDVTNINADPTTSYPARRQLVVASTGKVLVAATGVDTTATNTVTLAVPATYTALASADFSAWSAGYVAPATGGTGSSSAASTSSSAKVVIGTILSALFAIAFLN